MNRDARRSRSMRGSANVEMALTLLLFFSFAFAIVYAALVIFAWNNAAFAAREAARYASVHGASSKNPVTGTQLQSMVQSTAGLQNATVSTTWNPNNSAGSTVAVYVSVSVSVLVPLVSIKSISVASSSQMLIVE